jgi:uncharacterized membrane protein YoaK (UPF0700 family)
MVGYGKSTICLAVCLACLAGYVDALAFRALGGFFVSFMSGNSTRLGVGLTDGALGPMLAGRLIATFVLGVILGSFVGRAAAARRRPAVMIFVTLLLLIAAALNDLAAPGWAIGCMALAMGAENAVFDRDGEVSIGLTYMTGTLVKLGQRVTAALLGGDRWAWAPYAVLWLGLVLGALTGGLVYLRCGLDGLWLGAAASLMLTILAVCLDRRTVI